MHEVFPKLHRVNKPVHLHNEFKIGQRREDIDLLLEFYFHKLFSLAAEYPITYLSKFIIILLQIAIDCILCRCLLLQFRNSALFERAKMFFTQTNKRSCVYVWFSIGC